jgi:hypothetical protein
MLELRQTETFGRWWMRLRDKRALDTDEAMTIFMEEAFATEDPAYIAHALGDVARAKGMARPSGKRACRASSSTARSVPPGTRR